MYGGGPLPISRLARNQRACSRKSACGRRIIFTTHLRVSIGIGWVLEFDVAAAFRGSEARLFAEKGEWYRRYHETFPKFRYGLEPGAAAGMDHAKARGGKGKPR